MFCELYPKTEGSHIEKTHFLDLNVLIRLLIFFGNLDGAVDTLESKVEEQRRGLVLLHSGSDDFLSSAGKQVSTVFPKSLLSNLIIIPEVISKGERFSSRWPHVAGVQQSSCPEAIVRIKPPPLQRPQSQNYRDD